MNVWVASALALVIGYLLGSIPTGYLAGRILRDIDVREHGSKSTGATNVLRTLGMWPALAVLIVDAMKGGGAIVVALWLNRTSTPSLAAWMVCLAGFCALLGHGRSVWLNFTGGKSAATGIGVLLALSWPVGLGAVAAFSFVLGVTRIVSLSSILAAFTAMALTFPSGLPLPSQILISAGGLYVIVRHRANIERLLAGAEPRLARHSAAPKPGGDKDISGAGRP